VTGQRPYQHVVRSKLVPPPLPDGLIVRERVLERLSPDHRFTLISAMAGYGKTAVARQWVDAVDLPVAWLSLDLLDQEPLLFWSHLLLALGLAVPGVDDEPAELLRERGAGDALFLGALVAQLAEARQAVVLVLDGLSGQIDRATLEGLALLVERAGDTLRLVATTRTDPPLPLARWQAVGWLANLREDDLRLTDDEAVAIAAETDTSFRDVADVIALNERVHGWPIALHMALLANPADVDQPRSTSNLLAGSDRLLANYLVGEVLETMTEEERDVALGLSVLEWFDPDLCTELVGPHGADVVRQLLGRGMFLSVVDPRVGSMRFHDLFRELMEMELGWRDPATRVQLHRRAAMLWRARGDLMSAYHHLTVIGEAGHAHELLVGPALELVDRGDHVALDRMTRQLPTPQLVANADLALDLAVVALYAHGTVAARPWCNRAAQLMEEAQGADRPSPGTDDLAPRLNAVQCQLALLEADLDGAISGVANHPGRAGVTTVDAIQERFPIVAARAMLGARRGDEALEWITVAERIDGPEIVRAVTVPTLRAWHEWVFGRLDVATSIIDGALRWMAEHRVGAHHFAFDTAITAGWCRLSSGDLVDASRLAERATADAEALGNAWNQLQAGFLTSRLAVVLGEPNRALRIVDDLRAAISFDSCRPYAERVLGVEIEAHAVLGHTAETKSLIAMLSPGPRTQLLAARFLRLSEDEIDDLLATRAEWPVIERLQADLLLASRRDGTDPPPELLDVIAECRETGWVLPFLGLGPRVERMLTSLPLEDLHPRLARSLAFVAPDTPASRTDGGGVRLTSRELTLVELLPTHLSYAEMGEQLYLSVNTVKSNMKTLYRKLDATTRSEAVEASRRFGLL
jgi:LuxR family transcriptional regulator, maltose regulon positive regulatory protein